MRKDGSCTCLRADYGLPFKITPLKTNKRGTKAFTGEQCHVQMSDRTLNPKESRELQVATA